MNLNLFCTGSDIFHSEEGQPYLLWCHVDEAFKAMTPIMELIEAHLWMWVFIKTDWCI